ncbi:hypothetical protein VII00023_05332 [Vibrio ichthyoenteri ATCC 700023]|uniref:Uncharacterized protein n=1 Tax=Vibrio ichthyoenteri ATCC 700023 TaxID=870968 RepID=F9S135_9VIBR|nr:hypothetical protein VII00023_05332 [Vibrio ichthyoenteri ATCC 700023]
MLWKIHKNDKGDLHVASLLLHLTSWFGRRSVKLSAKLVLRIAGC